MCHSFIGGAYPNRKDFACARVCVCVFLAKLPLPQVFHCVFESKVSHGNRKTNCSFGPQLLFNLTEVTVGRGVGEERPPEQAGKDEEKEGLVSPWRPRAAAVLIQCPALLLPAPLSSASPRPLQLVPPEPL